MKQNSIKVALFLIYFATACESSTLKSGNTDIEKWMILGIQQCASAQTDLNNPFWDDKSGLPIEEEFDNVEVVEFPGAVYFAVTIGLNHPYPDSPSVLCHLSIESNELLYAAYQGGDPGNPQLNNQIKFEEYKYITDVDDSSIKKWNLSLRDVLELANTDIAE